MSDFEVDISEMQKLWYGTFVRGDVLTKLLSNDPSTIAQEWASNMIGPGPVFRMSDVPAKALELLGVK